ncbi:uncharacterized protein LOC127711841 isoform X2 [Mytilus californianus]|uniref:uncharacterized protein LOC127711841 isoform X1 n=1 Tax=Mytilus californianus TaxID=6549 RepID=UPI002247ED37|nr:uncharacterized protein LOC127711841 isoform X1 [Mytilus californianus]XP_052073974.1 uncharacterized protein LOC127711841 isoform X1 [Mytilus californianus]XP_052073981.1 uncharacterized protein LOC127711841 isoform X1 [Mytilus californianus]XP_052073986.1 uncharacterized protein LOC127711841 isoform X2 [Mytilus californianus]
MTSKKIVQKKEVEPLLFETNLTFHPEDKNASRSIYFPDEDDIMDDFEEEILEIEEKKRRHVSLLWQDLLLLTFDFLQIFALLQSMALRWTWSGSWIAKSYFFFLFNLDVWEFMKVYKDAYVSTQSYYTPSATVPMSYSTFALAGGGCILFLIGIFVAVYLILWVRKDRQFLSKTAWMRRIYLIFVQLLTLPIGVGVGHIFHCNGDKNVDVMNNIGCFQGSHWGYLVFGIFFYIVLFLVVPIYIIYRSRTEAMGSCSKHHEAYLLLKETEYKIGLNKVWLHSDIYFFSSFRYWGIYYRAILQLVKLSLVIVFIAGFHNVKGQATAVTILLFLYALLFVIVRPFRLICFNILLIMTFISLGAAGIIGTLETSYNAYTLDNPWLLPQYSRWLIMVTILVWLLTWLCVTMYLIVNQCLYRCHCKHIPIWPTFSTSTEGQLSQESRKFLKMFLRAKILLKKMYDYPVMFAPVHTLSKQIQILNAYVREAEYLGDALHGTMLDLLDEIIEVHSNMCQKSLFAESVKDSIRNTARQFLAVMPAFAKRLAQRDYDFILINPMKRRMLLKMYCMGIFLNGRSERVAKQKVLTKPELQRIWNEPSMLEFQEEDGYYEDLYPDPVDMSDSDSVDLSVSELEEEDDFMDMLGQMHEIEEINLNNARIVTEKARQKSAGTPRSQSSSSVRPSSASSQRHSTTSVRPSSAASQRQVTPVPPYARPGSAGSLQQTGSRPSSSQLRPGSGTSGRGAINAGFEDEKVSLPGSIDLNDEKPGKDNPTFTVVDEENDDKGSQLDIVKSAGEVIDMNQGTTEKGKKKNRKKKKKHSVPDSEA